MFDHVTIVGVGLLGASLGLALKERKLAAKITGVGRPNSPSLDIARQRRAIDAAATDLAQAAATADLLILCTPVRQFPDAFRTLRGKLKPGAIVTDVGSTKSQVISWATDLLDAPFVGSHPMAGSEKRGPDAARPDLYENATCLLCEGPRDIDRAATAQVESLWRAVGMKTLRLDPETHDRWVATVSHLPHAVAFSLMNAVAKHPEMLEAVAGGFIDTTRVASSDINMWTDIFLTNKSAVIAAIDEFAADLNTLKSAIAAGDEAAIRSALSNAKQSRDDLLARRANGGK